MKAMLLDFKYHVSQKQSTMLGNLSKKKVIQGK
jgi:hypothetical protein